MSFYMYEFVATSNGKKKTTEEFALKRSYNQKTPIISYKKTINGKTIKQSKSYNEIKKLLESKVHNDKKSEKKSPKKLSKK